MPPHFIHFLAGTDSSALIGRFSPGVAGDAGDALTAEHLSTLRLKH